MNKLDSPTIIAVVALLTGLGLIFQILLSPVKKDIARLEKGQESLIASQQELKASQQELKASQAEILSKLSALSINLKNR